MTGRLAHLFRYPVKSAGGEALDHVSLTVGQRLPGDRKWAVLTEAGATHTEKAGPGGWLPKACFLRGAASGKLQAVIGGWQGDKLHLRHPDLPDLIASPHDEGARIVDWLRPLWPADKPAPLRLEQAMTGFADDKNPVISILSLNSLRDLEARLGQPLGLHRWRANLWIEGFAPQSERNWIGHDLHIGKARLRVVEPIGRCTATGVDTTTGNPDIDMLAALKDQFGHTDFGIFAEVITSAEIALNDEVRP
ncbi:MAG: MOSC domain-containing protein [Paracoccus sp. (in: a-proteobacteria)]|uniref:MOSC domain-containing protein n=1 Tax=Paracoccus sp. TaxID=267 RepID=UPI0026DF3AF9|nr:MOSC N-terminal beta barrel domain-containing protein [Paracoccus sp. (in: a-proteobacteria)]MDO5620730.1 MOSC domain-containing protein [Paracoccus sp. (in: a-proteobacteria)]